MGKFHRFIDPSYYGNPSPLPAPPAAAVTFDDTDYNRINVTDDGTVQGGVPDASMSDSNGKVGGNNAGTYFIAFGESATASNVNRGFRALAENTDHLDDLLHRETAVSACKALVADPGAPVPTESTPAGTYVGNDPSYSLDRLFQVVDDKDHELYNRATGARIYVASISNGDGISVGDGFAENAVTITFSESIPAHQPYRIYYAERANLATLASDAFSFSDVRDGAQVTAELEYLFDQIQAPLAVNQPWNGTPYTTLYDLAKGGLNERYRRASAVDEVSVPTELADFFTTSLNAAGAGALINRDGYALTVFSQKAAGFVDPLDVLFRAINLDVNGGAGGSSGFVYYGNQHQDSETGAYERGRAGFMALAVHRATGNSGSTRTAVPPNAPATMTTAGAVSTFTITAPNYFKTGGYTSIVAGLDLLEVKHTATGETRTYAITAVTGNDTLTAKPAVLNVPIWADGACTITWHSTLFATGDGVNTSLTQVPEGLVYVSPPLLDAADTMYSGTTANEIKGPFAKFYGPDWRDLADTPALGWGYARRDSQGKPLVRSYLMSNGSISLYNELHFHDFPAGITAVGDLTISNAAGILELDTALGDLTLNAQTAGKFIKFRSPAKADSTFTAISGGLVLDNAATYPFELTDKKFRLTDAAVTKLYAFDSSASTVHTFKGKFAATNGTQKYTFDPGGPLLGIYHSFEGKTYHQARVDQSATVSYPAGIATVDAALCGVAVVDVASATAGIFIDKMHDGQHIDLYIYSSSGSHAIPRIDANAADGSTPRTMIGINAVTGHASLTAGGAEVWVRVTAVAGTKAVVALTEVSAGS